VWAGEDYLYLIETSRGEIWRYDGSSWELILCLHPDYKIGQENWGGIAESAISEHGQEVEGWFLGFSNKLYYFEPPGRLKRIARTTKTFWQIESWSNGLYVGNQEGGTIGRNNLTMGRVGYSIASVEYIPFSTLNRLMEKPLEFSCKLWDNEAIDAGDTTDPIPTWGYGNRTIKFLSDTGGTLTIKGDLFGENLEEFDTLSISANTPEFWQTTYNLARMSFSFDTAATVTLEVNLGK